jgi:hypothetical protein
LLKKKLFLLRIILASVVGIFLSCYLLLLIPAVQNGLVQMIAGRLSTKLGTEVKVGSVTFSLFDKLDIENVLVKDQHKDTLLYAHSFKLRISDLVFSSTDPVIKYIGIDHANIYLNRSTEKWNYQFILDYLSADTSKKQLSKIDFKKVDINHIHFVEDDKWLGQKMELSADNILANIKAFNDKQISIDQIIANKPYYLIQSFKALKPTVSRAAKVSKPTDSKNVMQFNPTHLAITVNEIQVIKGRMLIEYGFNKPYSYFDGEHIRMHDINAKINKVSLIEDTIKANVKSLQVKERSGFEIKKLSTVFKLTPKIMEFDKLNLKTNNSVIGPYFAMQFENFTEDFKNYNHKVVMKSHLVNASVATDDIAYFAPELSNLNQRANITCHFTGTVDHFETKDLAAQYNNSFLTGNFSMKGIPDMRNTQIAFTGVNAKTNYKDLSNWIIDLKDIKDFPFDALGELRFKGEFNGTLYDFVTKGAISTKMGLAETEIRLKFPAHGEPSYEGLLNTYQFNAGKLLNIQSLGLVNFKGKVAGTSFSRDKIKTNIEGNIDSIYFNHYTYTNINTNGLFQKGSFNGSLRIKDPNVNFISNIELDFRNKMPRINAVGDLLSANLRQLNMSNNTIQLTGLLDINFEGNNIDNFIGYAKFFNGKLKGEAAVVNFDSLTLQSSIVNGEKHIKFASDDIQANIHGKFNILHLPASVQYFMQRYLPTYIPAPKNTPANQQFSINIKTNYFEPYIRLFNKEISGFNNLNILGAINTDKQSIVLNANIPFASFKHNWADYTIKDGIIDGKGNIDSLHLNLAASQFNLTDSFSFIKPVIHINTSKDISMVDIDANSVSALERVSLNGIVHTYQDGISINWLPSYFLLNHKKWDIENKGSISVRESNTSASNLRFTQGLQEFILTNAPNVKNTLQLELKNVILGDITKLFFSYPRLEGITNGKIQLKNILQDFEMNAGLHFDQFAFNNDSIGVMQLNASYTASKGIVPFDFTAPNTTYNLTAKGAYNIKDSLSPLDATLYLHNSKFSLVQQFIGGVLTNLDGKATGDIHFGGRIEHPYLLGKAVLDNASFVVDYTKVKYNVDSGAIIKFTNEGIDFGTIQVSDKLNRKASFKGKILNQGFQHLVYDMEMNSPRIELLNTDVLDNSNFYGRAVGKASMTIKGPEENIKMSINADVNDSSHIYLPNTTSKESGKSDFIVFKKYGKTAIKSADIPSYNLVVDLEVTANNKTQIDVIMDELTGDVIKGVGNGRIKIRAGNIEPLTMRGRYNIESGKYDFNFQSLIRKPFELIPEAGNYIEWTGNPNEADIHMDARYTAERVSLTELVGSANFSNAVKGYRGSVYVIAALRNKLSQPDIKFSLAFPQGNPISSDNEFSQFISRLERDDNEILKQVSFLIVFNSFAPVSFNSSNNNSAYTVTAIGINTISQLLTKEINKSISQILTKATGDNNLRFDIGSSVYNSGNLLDPTGGGIAINANKIDRTRVNLKLGRSFLNDKVIVNVGGDLDFNVRNTTIRNSDLQWLPDLNIEFILTRDRKLRAIIFNRNSLDINGSALGKRNRQGVSISYRKDFDEFTW